MLSSVYFDAVERRFFLIHFERETFVFRIAIMEI